MKRSLTTNQPTCNRKKSRIKSQRKRRRRIRRRSRRQRRNLPLLKSLILMRRKMFKRKEVEKAMMVNSQMERAGNSRMTPSSRRK